jgi:hypothetical protein
MRRTAAAGIVALLAAGCAGPESPGGLAAAGGSWSGPEGGPPRVHRRPAGGLVVDGTVDELGWVLPLDVVRAPSPRAAALRATGALPAPRARPRGPSPFPETRLGPDDGHSENETAIAVDGDTVVAGWNGFVAGGVVMGVARSGDGGATWDQGALGTGFDVTSDPAVAAGGSGRWYYSYIARTAGESDYDVWVQRSLDDGVSWLPPVAAVSDANFDDKSYVAAAGDEVLVAYADFGVSPAKVHAVRSIDGGLSFDHDTVLANASVGGNGACPVIAPDGTSYVFWRDSFQDFLWMSRSDDAGVNWTPDESIVEMNPLPSSVPAPQGGYRLLNLPAAAAGPDGELVVVWNDQRFGDADILAIRSDDGGDTWSEPVRVNDDAAGNLQFFPWVAIDGAGDVHVVWYDRRHDAVDLDVYYARSSDGGASFTPNVRLTAASFTPVLPSEGGAAAFIGDYNGIAAGGGRVFPFYQDARRGEQDVWISTLPLALFADGFESGDTAAWSAASPLD